MEKPEIIHYAVGQDPETRRKVLRHPDIAPLVREIIRTTIDVMHSAHHLQMVSNVTRGAGDERIVNDGMTFLCRVENAGPDVVAALADYVCAQGITSDQMAKTILRAMSIPRSTEKPVDLAKEGGTVASLVGDMLEGIRKN